MDINSASVIAAALAIGLAAIGPGIVQGNASGSFDAFNTAAILSRMLSGITSDNNGSSQTPITLITPDSELINGNLLEPEDLIKYRKNSSNF